MDFKSQTPTGTAPIPGTPVTLFQSTSTGQLPNVVNGIYDFTSGATGNIASLSGRGPATDPASYFQLGDAQYLAITYLNSASGAQGGVDVMIRVRFIAGPAAGIITGVRLFHVRAGDLLQEVIAAEADQCTVEVIAAGNVANTPNAQAVLIRAVNRPAITQRSAWPNWVDNATEPQPINGDRSDPILAEVAAVGIPNGVAHNQDVGYYHGPAILFLQTFGGAGSVQVLARRFDSLDRASPGPPVGGMAFTVATLAHVELEIPPRICTLQVFNGAGAAANMTATLTARRRNP